MEFATSPPRQRRGISKPIPKWTILLILLYLTTNFASNGLRFWWFEVYSLFMRMIIILIALFLGFVSQVDVHALATGPEQSVGTVEVASVQIVASLENAADQQGERDCCWDGSCCGTCHGHNCSGVAALLNHDGGSTGEFQGSDKLGAYADTMRILFVSFPIIDPPIA